MDENDYTDEIVIQLAPEEFNKIYRLVVEASLEALDQNVVDLDILELRDKLESKLKVSDNPAPEWLTPKLYKGKGE